MQDRLKLSDDFASCVVMCKTWQ